MKKDTPSYKYFSNIVDLPLRNYMDVAVRSNYNSLTISGDPPMEELETAWKDIQQQYADVMADLEYQHYLNKVKELAVLNVSQQQVHIAVTQLGIIVPLHLSTPDDPDFNDMLEQYTDSLHLLIGDRFNFRDPDKYIHYLKRCLARGKGIGLEIKMKEQALEAMKKNLSKESAEPTDEYYLNILISLADYAGYQLTDQITVYEFCDRFRRMSQAHAKMKQKPGKR